MPKRKHNRFIEILLDVFSSSEESLRGERFSVKRTQPDEKKISNFVRNERSDSVENTISSECSKYSSNSLKKNNHEPDLSSVNIPLEFLRRNSTEAAL